MFFIDLNGFSTGSVVIFLMFLRVDGVPWGFVVNMCLQETHGLDADQLGFKGLNEFTLVFILLYWVPWQEYTQGAVVTLLLVGPATLHAPSVD